MELFSFDTGKKMEWTQAKSKCQRIRQDIKKKNDKKEKDKEFRRQCSLTGGGVGPRIPKQEDGDDVDVDLHLNDMDPTDTDFKGLVCPGDKMESQSRDMLGLAGPFAGPSGLSGSSSNVVKISSSSVPNRPTSKIIGVANNLQSLKIWMTEKRIN